MTKTDLFMKYVSNLHIADFARLTTIGQSTPNAFIHDECKGVARRCNMHELAWPVEFTLGQHNRKHIFSCSRICIPDLSKALTAVSQKLAWACVFEFSADEVPTNPCSLLKKSCHTALPTDKDG